MTWYSCKMVIKCSYTINATLGCASVRTRRCRARGPKPCSLTDRANGKVINLRHPKQPRHQAGKVKS